MNKHLYRIIFNKARNMLMVVADIATSGQGSTVRRRSRRQSSKCLCRLTALRLSLLLATGCISLTAQADIVADRQAPGNQQPTILNSANGTPQINIQTPSAAGVSRNTYSQFDIDKQGVILNNSHNAVQTQLGGMVAGNPWLAKAEAKIILNEVNSINPSLLNGWIEVAGQKAEIIIANPAGITCNGCGFINAHRTTLTTGQAMMEQGRLKGFDISRGEVRIEGLGMDSSQQNYTEIIARSVAINGKLHAQDLKVTTGRNIVDAAHKNIEKKSADDNDRPKFTLDVAALGGMYANKITLVGTEAGVGVRNAGHIGASAGEVRLTTDGQIENRGTIAARGNTTITASTIQSNKGSILAAGIDDKGKATQPGSLTLSAKQQIQANGQNLATNALEVQSKKIDLSGSQTSADNIQLTASQNEISTSNATVTTDRFTAKTPGQFNNDGGKLVAREINLTTPDLSNNQGKINQTGKSHLVLNTQKLSNRGGTLFNEGKQLTITTAKLDNHRGKIANNGHNLNLTLHEADNTLGTIQLSGEGKLSLNTQQWIGDGGNLLSNGELDIQAHNLQLNKKAVTTANKITMKADTLSHQSGLMQQKGKDKMSLTANTLNNNNGKIEGNGNLTINATTVNNSKGKIIAAEESSLDLTVNDALDNRDGRLKAGKNIQLTSTQLDNSQGTIIATGGSTELIIGKNIKNADGRIEAKTQLTTKSQELNNHQGRLLAQQINSQTKGHKFINTAGKVIAREKLRLNSGELDNTAGLLQSGSDMIVNTHGQKLTNANSDNEKGILSKGELELRTGDINNTAGIISAKGKTTLTAGNVDNTDGKLLSQQMAELTTQALDNTRGQIQSESTLLLDTQNQALTNTDSGKTGGIIAKDSLRISSGTLNNDAGLIQGHGINIDTHQQALSNQSGNTGGVISEGTLTLTTGEIDNQDGSIIGTGTTTVTGGELHNQRGKLASKTGSLTLTVNKTDNNGGLMQSAGDLTLDTQGRLLTNTNSGKDRGIISTGNMKLTTQGVNNNAGLIHAGKNLILDGQKGTITNRNSQPDQGILSSENLTLTADAIDNHQGTVTANQQLTVTSGIVDNTGGLLKSGSTLSLNTQGQKLTNAQSGDKRGIRSGNDLTLVTGEIDNTAGVIDSQGETTLTSHNLNNTDGKILSQGKADLTTQAVNNQRGQIQSAASLDLDTQQQELVNTDSGENGGIIAQDALELTTGKLINDRGSIRGDQTHINTHQQALNNLAGTIASKKNLKLDSGELDSTGGRIESVGDMTLDTHGEKLTTAKSGDTGGVISKGTLTLTTDEIDNHDGVIIGKGTTTVTGGELNNRGGTLASETGALKLTVGKTDNNGGLLQSADDLTLDTRGELLTNTNSGKSGGIISTGNMKLTAQGINNETGRIHADKNLILNGLQGKITNRKSQPEQGISSLGTLTMTAGAIDNQQGRVIADKQLKVTSTGTVDNTSGKMFSQHQQLTLNTGELNNTGGLLRSKTTLSLNTHGQKLINTQSGDKHGILSGGDLTLKAGEVDNTAGVIDSQGTATLTSQNLNNTDGKILSQGKANLTTQTVNNQHGLVQSATDLELDTQQHELTNTDSGKLGGVIARNILKLTTGKLTNDRGFIRGDETYIDTQKQALNNLGGIIFSKKNLQLDSGELDSTGGTIESDGDITLDTHGKKLTTAQSGKNNGVISKGTLTLTTGEIDNRDGSIIGTGTTTVTGGELKNQGGTLVSKTGALTLTVNETSNSGGLLQSAGNLTLDTQGGLLTNINSGKNGGIISTGNMKLTAQGINNEAGRIHADKNLILDGLQGKITNRKSHPEQGISSQGTLTITAGTIDNHQGIVATNQQLKVTSSGIVDNTGGTMVSQHQQLTLNTGELNNTGGLLKSGTTLSLDTHGQKLTNAQSGDNHGIRSGSDLTLGAGKIDNTAGVIGSQGEITLISQNLNNTDGKILSQGKASLTTKAVNNQRGLVQSAASLELDTQQQELTNTDSGELNGIMARDTMKLTTGKLTNDRGFIRGDETHIDTQKQSLHNKAGTIVSKKNLQLDSGELDSTGGKIESAGDMTLDTHGEKLTTAKSGDNGGVISKGTMTLTTGEIDNHDGVIIGTGKTTITGGKLKNQRGTLASKTDALELSVNETDNSGGLLHSAGKLTLNTNGHTLTNENSDDQSGIRSQDDMLITSGDLHNQAGIIASHKIATLNTAAVNNTQGTLTGTQQIELTTQAFNNLKGIVRTDGKLSLNTQGQRLDNNGDKDKSSEFSARGDLRLDIGELNNDTGFIAADGKTDITGTTLTNNNGRIAGNGGLEIHSQTLTNHNGTLQSAETVNIDTNKQLLDNQHGRIIGDNGTTVTSGKLDNRHGHIQGGKLVIDTGQADTDNQDGKLLSTDTMDLDTQQLDNRHGQIKAVGDAAINAQKQTNNTGGFIHGNQQLALNTAKLINRETNHPDQGTEAQNLIIKAQQVDNTQGALRGANSLQTIVSQTLNNTQGLISGGKRLTIEDEDQKLTVNNQKGTLIASEKTSIKADTLSGDGQVLSQGDMEIKLKQDFHNTGNTAANGKLSLETTGNIINDSTIKAEQAYLAAKNLTNTQAAEISAGKTRVNIRDTLTNTGLIDGELTHLTAKILNNTGTGRIYGDRIAFQTGTLNNTAQDGKAAAIAARDRMDIATGILNNSNHAQIYSVGDMNIGGQLDENLTATSQAGRLSNHAATIEAGRNLGINAAIIRNTNDRLVTQVVETEKSQRHEAVLSGHTTRYDWSEVDISYKNRHGVHTAVMPDGSDDNKFYEYQYTRTVTETQIKESDPGKILAGGNITLNSTMLTNNDSQIVAGAILGGNIDELHNNSTKGERITADEGNQIRWYPKKKKRRLKRSKRSQGKSWSDYRPAPITETIDLKALAWQGNTRPDATGITISDRQTGSVQSAPAGINLVSRMAGAGDVTLTNATINAITLSIPTQTDDRSLQANDRGTTVSIPTETVTLPNRDILVDRPLFSPTGQQTELILPSGTVALPNRDALTEHPTLSPTSQQTERVRPPDTITLPDSGTLAERPLVLPTGQQFELALPPDTVKGQTVEPLIRIVAPETRLPDNSLYIVQPGSDSHYLVETDPKFTQYKKWLGTDYMQQQLTNDPALAHKRLGDGFYEQRLVRDQITQLTGHRYLAGHNNDEAQFKALMEAGVAFGKQQQLTPGIALSPAQMALLTSDIIWLTNRTVTLSNGSTQTVTVPQVYARVHKGDLTGDGALLSGHNVILNSRGDITNSGTISGREVTQLTANNLTNSGFIQSGKVDLTARQDITNRGGSIQGQDRVSALAGRDITSTSTLRDDNVNRWLDRPAGIYVQNDNSTLSLKAINNVQLTASEVKNAGKDSQTEITAGRDLTLDTLRTRRTENGDWGKDNYRHLTQEHDIGSQITTAGNLALRAGNNLNATAANVNAGQQLTAQAGNNLTLNAGTASSDLVEHSKQTSKGLLSKSSVETHDEIHERRAVSTTLSGDSVTVQAGKDLNIIGSNVAGTQDVNLAAGNQLTVTTADEARHETHLRKEKKSGLMGTGGIGFTVGKASQKSTTDIDSNLSKGSTVGSSQGNVTLNAGERLNVHGSDVVAGQDMTLTGQDVTITSAENSHTAISKTEQKQSGLTVALSGTAGSAVNTAVQTVKAASSESDSRLKALQGTKAALNGVQAVQAARLADAKGGDNKTNNNLVGINLSYGSQSSRSEQKQHQTTQQGSSLTTGDNLNITATGNDTPDQNGDIRVQGGRLQAGKDLQLNANRDIQLTSSQNTEQTTGSNSSSGGSLGVGFTAGPGGTGLNVSASVNYGKGRESGDGVSHNETTLDAGQNVTLNAGRDATLKGAQVSGEQITADVKRNLTLTSEQDSNRYDMKQQNVSAGASVTVGPQTDGTLSLNVGRDKIHSNFDSVQEQTGLFAGKGGYEVKVGEHTQLDGAVIASTADKAKNTLDTGTLSFGDIQNKADFKTEHRSAGFSTGGPVGSSLLSNLASNTLGGANKEGHAQSTTHAAVSDGTIAIRDKDHQQQDITTLSRDTDNAGNALSPIFDKEKEQKRLRQAQLIREISAQVIDIAGTEGSIIATKAANAKMANISEQDKADARAKLAKTSTLPPTEDDIKNQIYNTAYNQALNDSGFGTGGKYQTALQAATAAIQGLAGGNIGQVLAGGASPYLAGVIKDMTTDRQTGQVDVATNTLAHAILGAVVAEASGNNALAGAAGAASGELAAQALMKHFHGEDVKVSDLSEEEKQTISTLSTLAAGLAGGIAGDSTGSTVAGAQAGKNAIENNALASRNLGDCRTLSPEACGKAKELSQRILDKGLPSVEDMRGKLASCQDDRCRKGVWTEYRQASDATINSLKQMALNGELSREELAFINHELGKELAVSGYRANDKLGRSEQSSWLNGGSGPLSGFFNTELRQKELENAGLSKADAAQYVKEEQRNLLLLETAVGAIGAKANRTSINVVGKGATLPTGYTPKGNSVTGPKGSVYGNTGKVDASGNTIYSNNGGYYTFENGVKTKVQSPNSDSQIRQNYEKGKEFEQSVYDKLKQDPKLKTPVREVTIETNEGTKVRVDIMAKDRDGSIRCIECKSSQTAPLTKNQKTGFPELKEGGGTVVGKGRPGFESGTKIPPTEVEIVRPNAKDN
ncbi:hemagglutinin repeat-containing protein [Photorhabdus temperata]|uniref:Filamentous hemagglutinin family n=2 Tax=Photorhabdus TaxID=29487 RepID=A0A081RX73_PHOTE|nr:hemagglutinin repeat-containing protein [Photorhabdus temperata]KER03276.1 filamentous hemagglutinin family [Photorhabdus temperata subsp. temperata Meg1]